MLWPIIGSTCFTTHEPALLWAAASGRTAMPATIWAALPGERLSEDYTLRVDDQPVPVYACRVSTVPFNQVWPGCQRPMDQTELAGFALPTGQITFGRGR